MFSPLLNTNCVKDKSPSFNKQVVAQYKKSFKPTDKFVKQISTVGLFFFSLTQLNLNKGIKQVSNSSTP